MATYYVSSSAGNDSAAGTSPGTAWKSLSKVTSYVFVPGDTVLFNRGDTWFPWDNALGHAGGTFTIGESGSSGSPITFDAYGTGANPVISGFYPVPTTGWTQVGTSNVWTLTDTTNFPTTMINTLMYNGSATPLARLPTAATGYLTYTSGTTTQLNFASGTLNKDFNTGEVVIRKSHFTLTRGTITSTTGSSSTSLTYTASGTNQLTPTNGYGFFVQNHQNCLAQPGDWCYNPATQTLSMWFTSGPTGTILISVTDSLVAFASSKNYNIFNNFDFIGGNNYGINGNYGGTNNQVNNCSFSNIGMHAIYLGGANSCIVSGNSITDSVNNAIYLSDAVNNSILSNTINGTGQIAGMGQSFDGTNGTAAYSAILVGFSANGSGNKIIGNAILNSGYNGIIISGDTYIIDNNYVDTACNVMDDGGCIYTNSNAGASTNYLGRVISNNTVLNSVGAPAGTDGTSQGAGIYTDDNASNLTINNNSVYNCSQYGIFLHNGHEISCVDNLSYNNTISQLALIENNTASNHPKPVNFAICNNILFANSSTQLCIIFELNASNSVLSDFANIGVCNHNSYGSLFSNTDLFSTQLSLATPILHDFASWQSYTSLDPNSTTQFRLTIPPTMGFSS
ncbi:MAG TPA: right-handed parallel beta-helix repeat-containing protein [Mucilaginibacter sp.]|nr:right-handed parallel beta-helix repeat-containing protein [Mucilaginibacter sp.]